MQTQVFGPANRVVRSHVSLSSLLGGIQMPRTMHELEIDRLSIKDRLAQAQEIR